MEVQLNANFLQGVTKLTLAGIIFHIEAIIAGFLTWIS